MPSYDLFLQNVLMYWKGLFVVVYAIVLLPIFLVNNTAATRCVYVVVLMGGYWVFEALPIEITALIPVVLFPPMGILDARTTSMSYFKEANMLFVGSLIIALAIQFCNLHTRISLHAIKLIGCSYRRLNFGLVTLTMFISMWISNTSATAMMIPIIQAVLKQLEEQGLGSTWEPEDSEIQQSRRRPTRVTMCFYIGTAYAASIGGLGSIEGGGINLVLKGIYNSLFDDHGAMEFSKWSAANVPLMIAIMYPTWLWLQFWYMGLFRPNSADAKAINIGKKGEEVTRAVLTEKLAEMGDWSTHEILVGVLFILEILLWVFRKPPFLPGWAELITETYVGDSTAAIFVVVLLFIVPANLDFVRMFSKSERPTAPSDALITWEYIHAKMHWGFIFLMGGGFALAEGISNSGMGELISDELAALAELPRFVILILSSLSAMLLTQFAASMAVAGMILPIVANIAIKAKVHPLYLMMPVCLACSFAYLLPVSTPPNAIAARPCNMRTIEIIKVGLMVEVISFVMLITIFPILGPLIWDFSKLPDLD